MTQSIRDRWQSDEDAGPYEIEAAPAWQRQAQGEQQPDSEPESGE